MPFTVAANAYELNNLDNDALDAPIFALTSGSSAAMSNTAGKHQTINGAAVGHDRNFGSAISDFASLPCQSVLVASCTKSESTADRVGLMMADADGMSGANSKFEVRNHPVYQSAHAQTMGRHIGHDETASSGADCVDGVGGRGSGGK